MHLYSRLITRASSPYFSPYFNPNTCDQFILRYYTYPYSFTPSYPSPRSAFPVRVRPARCMSSAPRHTYFTIE